jgi:hypothetical protein
MDIKDIINEVVREILPDVIREVLRGELGATTAGPKGKAGGKHSLPVRKLKRGPNRPAMAAESGVKIGQKWEAKPSTSFPGRVIRIENLGKEKILPKVIDSKGKRAVAKPISYDMLTKNYALIK